MSRIYGQAGRGQLTAKSSERQIRERILGLDALRGVAAMAALLYHAVGTGRGYLAVDFFFLLSGFVMARTYEGRMSAGLGAFHFLKMRWKRFVPVLVIGVVPGWALMYMEANHTLPILLMIGIWNALLLPWPSNNQLFPTNPPMWSAFYELIANFLHVVVLFRMKGPALTLITVILLMALTNISFQRDGLEVGYQISTIDFGFVRAMAPYSLGVLLYRTWGDNPPITIPFWAAISVFIAITMAPTMNGIEAAIVDVVFVTIFCPLILFSGLIARPSYGRWLGRTSFPLYSIHLPIVYWLHFYGFGSFMGVVVPLVIVAAGLPIFDRFVETTRACRRTREKMQLT